MVFVHGWPDTPAIWKAQVDYYTAKSYCCITLENPNYDISFIQNPWGYDIMGVVNALAAQTVDIVGERPFILIAHDWGAYFAQLMYIHWKHQLNVSHLVLLDVGDGGAKDEDQSKYKYQMVNAMCFLMPRSIGTWYMRRYYRNLLASSGCNLKLEQFPAIELEQKDKIRRFDSIANYSYFWGIWVMMFGSNKSKKDATVSHMLNLMEDVPILFLDAKKGWFKPVQYYSGKYRKWIEGREDCKFVELDCYHWIQHEEPLGDWRSLHSHVDQFISKSN